MKTAKSIICLVLAAMMLLGAPLSALAQEEAQEIPQVLIEEGEGFELPEVLPAEEETAEIPAAPEAEEDPPADGGGEEEEPEGPDGFPAADEEMIGNTTDSSRLATRYELSDLYGQTVTSEAEVLTSLISDEARDEFSSAIDMIAAFEPVDDADVSLVLGKVETFLTSGGVNTYLTSGSLQAGAEIGLTENRTDKLKILGTEANAASGWVYVVDKDAMSWQVLGPDGMGIPEALVTISYLDGKGERVTKSIVATADNTPGIAVFDDLPDEFFGIVDVQAEGYRAVSILDKLMGKGNHFKITLEEAQPDELYIRGIDLAGKDMVNEETKLALVDIDTADLALKVIVTKTGSAQFPEAIDLRADGRGTVLTVSQTSGYAYDSNTRIYTAAKRWVEQDAGLLKDGDTLSVDLGSGTFAMEHVTVEDAVARPGSGQTEVPVTTKALNGDVTDRLSGSGFLNQTMQMLQVPVQFGMFPDGSMVLMASYDITRLDPNTQYKFSSLFEKSWNPKDTENLQDPLEIFEESFWENTDKVKKGDKILESDNKIKCVANWSYDFSISFSLYLRSNYNKETNDNYGSGGILFSGGITAGLTEYFLLPAGPIIIPAYIGFEGHLYINVGLNVNFGMDQPPTGHDQDKEWSYSTDDGTDVNARIEVIAGISVFGGIGVKGVLGVNATGYVDFDIAAVIGKGRAEFGKPHSFIDVLYGVKFNYYLLFYSGTITIKALNGAERLDDSEGQHDLLTESAGEMEFTEIPLDSCAENYVPQVASPGEDRDEAFLLQDAGGMLEGQPDIVNVDTCVYPDTQIQFAATKDYTALFRLASNGSRTDIYYQLQNRETGDLRPMLYKVQLPAGETRSVTEFVVVPNKTDADDPDYRNMAYIGAVLADNTLTDETERLKSTEVAAIVVDLDRTATVSSVIAGDPSMQGKYYYSAPRPAGREDYCSVAYAATRLTDANGDGIGTVKGLLGAAPEVTYYWLSWGAEDDPAQRSFLNTGRNKVHSTGAIAPNEPSFWTVDPLRSSDKTLVVNGYGANGYYEETLRCNFRIDIDGIIDKQDLIDGTADYDSIISNWQYLNGCNYFVADDSVYWMNKKVKGSDPSDYEWEAAKVIDGSGVISVDDRYTMITNNDQSAVYLIGTVGDYSVDFESGTSEKGWNIVKIYTITTKWYPDAGRYECRLHGPLDLRFAKGDVIGCFAAAYNPESCRASGLTVAYSTPEPDGSAYACRIRMWKQNADRGLLVTKVTIPDYLVLTGQQAVEVNVTVRNYGYGCENGIPYELHDENGKTLLMTNGKTDFDGSGYYYTGYDLYTGDSRTDKILVRPDPSWEKNKEHTITVEVREECRYNGDLDDVVNSAVMEADNITLTAANSLQGGRHYISTSIENNTLTGLDRPTVKIVLDYGGAEGSPSELNFPLPMREQLLRYGEDDEAYVGQTYFFDIDMESVWTDGLADGLRGAWVLLTDDEGNQVSNGQIYLTNPAETPEEEKEGPVFKSQSLVLSGQIAVKFNLELPEIEGVDYRDSYVEFTVGKDAPVKVGYDQATLGTNGRYGFLCYVKSIQMADTITAVFHYGDGKTVSKEYSVEQYIRKMDTLADQYDARTLALIHAIADYGHYAQLYLSEVNKWEIGTDYKAMNTFYATTYDYAGILSTVTPKAFVKTLGSSDVEKAVYKMHLDAETTIDVYLTPKSGKTLTASATFNGKTYMAEKQADGRYLVRIPNISAHLLGDMITIRGTAGSEFTIQVCALSYVRSVLANAGSSEAAKNGLSSLYAYYAATMAYRQKSST